MQPGHGTRNSLPDIWSAWLHDDIEVQQLQLYLQRHLNRSSV